MPSLREAVAARLGVDLGDGAARADVDAVEAECRRLLEGGPPAAGSSGEAAVLDVGRRRSSEPALDRTPDEIGAVLAALDGRWVPPGPSGAPTRGMAHVLPTGRNFYSVDPKALPSRLAWEVGQGLADRLLAAPPRRGEAATRPRSGWWCGAPRRCAPAATTWPRRWPCWVCGRSGRPSPAG